ncbi:hypothetical protein TSAR_006198 [Trichomalopsis sarcophagae]|uniref:Transforming acidic coiled-coil-containing protein C-terminal domain-containing protein n=1 Tax=Trichomalopsis sarcophagae TaxID=543379 RepID=A0A232FBH8_9HYME|nr:hypothetical protein TSAR_006198 [Trichomalopsis sarcophagae]
MDFLNRLLNRPTPKPAICHGSPTRQQHESAGEAALPFSRPQSDSDHNLIRFSRDFSEAASNSSGPSSLVPESLSSASSFQSLASTLSSKSSSGICADSAPGSPDKVNSGNGFDHSYVNVDIPDLDDLISACANINLNNATVLGGLLPGENRARDESPDSSGGDLSQDQTFASAADDTLADETQVLVEETIQTFKTCPPLEVTQVTSTETHVFKAPLPVDEQSSVIPYLSFEESVLRKHQELADGGDEFKSALTSFQATQSITVSSTVDTRRRSYSPTPCEEIDVARVAKITCKSPKDLDITQESLIVVVDEVVEKKEQIVDQDFVLGTPDASFEEVQAFNSTIILNTDLASEEPTVSDIKNEVVDKEKKKPVFSLDEVPVGVKTKGSEIVQETIPNILNHTHDNAQDTGFLNKTQDIVQDANVLNNTQDIVQNTNILNQTQNIAQEQTILNKTQDIVQEESNLIKTGLIAQEVNKSVNKNEVIVQQISDLSKPESVQSKTQHFTKEDNFVEKKKILKYNIGSYNEIDEKPIKPQIQEAQSPKVIELNEENTWRTPQKLEETFAKPEAKSPKQIETFANEETQNLNLINTEAVASTPLPVKNLNKAKTPKTPKTKSALFTNEPKSPKPPAQTSKTPIKSEEIKEEKNKLNFDQTLAINKSLEQSSFSATELITNLETTSDVLHENLFIAPIRESEYEAFKPVQQSTTLPFPDFKKLQEAALSVAKEIDESLEKIEETEQFVSATTELFGDPSALDFLTQVGSQHPTKRGERYDSLYMKFDPLAQRLSMLPQKNLPTAPSVDEEEEKEKETKVNTPSSEMGTPKKNPALAAIDRLLFYSPCPPSATESAVAEAKQKKEEAEKQESPVVPFVDEKMAKELELVRTTVLQLEAELEKQKQEHREQLEKQKAAYEEKVTHMQTKFTQMQSQLTQEVKVVVEEYEKSISRLIAEREKDRTSFEVEKGKLQEELQVANQHLSNTEAAFSDVHSKYERLKNVVSAYKSNETVLKESIAENQETIKTLENRYEQLKSHAMAQLEKANLELSAIRKQNEAETVKLKALVRKAELKSKSLAETVEQKIKENKELTQIIDEMIARVD